jgi:GNAT superfamily N-acetyltransferase
MTSDRFFRDLWTTAWRTRPSVARWREAASPEWVPIRSLARRHKPRILSHLLALPENDRYLRFGYPATDEQIRRYVDGLDFKRDQIFGIFADDLTLAAFAQLAYTEAPQRKDRPPMVEFGVSVASASRGLGYGRRLFQHAVLHARNRGTDQLFIHALSENTAMLKIARQAGASIERDGSESEAWLKLPEDTLGTQVHEVIEEHAAEMHYRLQVQMQRVRQAWGLAGRVGRRLGVQWRKHFRPSR